MSDGKGDTGIAFTAADLHEIDAAVLGEFLAEDAPTVLRLLPVDPWRVYAFWSVTPDELMAARAKAALQEVEPPLVLRFFDQTPRAHPPFDVEVQGASNGWYVDLWKDGKSYIAELGLGTGAGFSPLLRSNAIDLPPAGPSPDLGFLETEVRLARTEPQDLFLPAQISPLPLAGEGGDPRRGEGEGCSRLSDEFQESRGDGAGSSPHPNPLPQAGEGVADSFPLAVDEAAPPGAAEAAEDEARVLQAMAQEAVPDLPRGSDRAALAPVPAPESPPAPLPLENLVSLSSFALAPDVEFELNADLHIYGRARPGCTLSLYGRPVTVAADGSFSVRRPLPNGALILPVLLAAGPGGGEGA